MRGGSYDGSSTTETSILGMAVSISGTVITEMAVSISGTVITRMSVYGISGSALVLQGSLGRGEIGSTAEVKYTIPF